MIEIETSQLILLLRTFQIRAVMLLKVCVVKYVDKFVCWSITYMYVLYIYLYSSRDKSMKCF